MHNEGVLLNRDDVLSEVLTLEQACEVAKVSRSTLNRWIAARRLRVLPGGRVIERELLACEQERWKSRRRGRPGPRLGLDELT